MGGLVLEDFHSYQGVPLLLQQVGEGAGAKAGAQLSPWHGPLGVWVADPVAALACGAMQVLVLLWGRLWGGTRGLVDGERVGQRDRG